MTAQKWEHYVCVFSYDPESVIWKLLESLPGLSATNTAAAAVFVDKRLTDD